MFDDKWGIFFLLFLFLAVGSGRWGRGVRAFSNLFTIVIINF